MNISFLANQANQNKKNKMLRLFFLQGHVLQTTTSMVEMLIKVTTSSNLDQSYLVPEDQIKPETILIARVVMVARNSKTGGKWTVPRLLPALDDPSEQSLTGILNQIRLPRLMSSSKSTSPTQSKSPLSLVRERFTIYAGGYALGLISDLLI